MSTIYTIFWILAPSGVGQTNRADLKGTAVPSGGANGIHRSTDDPWPVLLSAPGRVLAERFVRRVRLTPIEYLLSWRMVMAKRALRQGEPVAESARKIGYGSTTAFSTAFSRVTGSAPGRFARQDR